MNIKRSLPLLGTIVSLVGLTATTYFAAKNGHKVKDILEKYDPETDNKKETIKKLMPVAAPIVLSYTATAAGIITSYISGNNLYKATAASLSAASLAYKEYRDKNIEIYGEEADKNILDAVTEDHVVANTAELPDGQSLYFEPVLGTFFTGTKETCMNIERTINKAIHEQGCCCMADIYQKHGIPTTNSGWKMYQYGWNYEDLYSGYFVDEHYAVTGWIEVHYNKKKDLKHGEYYELDYCFWPWEDWFDETNRCETLEEAYGIH